VLISMHQFFAFCDKRAKNGLSQPGSVNYSPSLDHIAAITNLSTSKNIFCLFENLSVIDLVSNR